MSIWQIDVEKRLGSEYWTNVYHINNTDIESAESDAQAIVAAEIAIHANTVTFTKFRMSDMSTTFFQTSPINQQGARAIGTDILPLWNVVRVDLGVTGRRPCRKYLRLPLDEPAQNAGILAPDLLAVIATTYVQPLLAFGRLSNEFGDAVYNGSVMPQVAMRQLRRGSKRRTQPIL